MDNNLILIVEDEKNISDVIKAYLEKENYTVITAFDGQEAIDKFKSNNISLIILDLMIPKIPGEEVCSIVRNISDVPIIMLTAKSDEDDKIQGLTIGADDYIVKPFSPRELVTRVKVLMRRSYRDTGPLAEKLMFNDGLQIDIDKFLVTKKDKEIDLTANEFKVLLTLASNPSVVFSREQLISQAFGLDYEGFDRTIDTHIKNIRQKIEDNPKKPKYILTVYGVGYRFQG
ncbi:response regulator transcription factor [Wansuia hejianensis]|uniref:Stage 0 sporulation protein A homolog n=1 Tax=Wansuia hejianensis TaxID=2763667 RepID=A0A926IML5_9FIRM|nr:response regulator transcription factor [Wansuia hejianensis]MBC8591314.1 response regulator transcription factor [Wansuia hejianensis]